MAPQSKWVLNEDSKRRIVSGIPRLESQIEGERETALGVLRAHVYITFF